MSLIPVVLASRAVAAARLLLTRLRSLGPERGQATTEYALVLIAAATVALALLAWATKSGAVGDLADAVFSSVRKKVK